MEGQDGIAIRPMRLKVLYTFDDKTNCLARWPQLLDIQTAYLDEGTPIGVIELKTCIQAIVSASPELVAKLGRDYTVYAYDYSEYETPLVGQGMLSWVLASASPTPNAPAHQSKTIVTGRVCKNALGVFSRGAQETLEVKLRLVPVPTALQSEYLSSMQKYRDISDVIPHDFDAQAWTNFLQANPGVLANIKNQQQQQPQQQQSQQQLDQEASDTSGIEKLQQLLSESSTPRDFSNLATENFQAESPYATNAPSRTSTPGASRPPQKRGSTEAFRPSSRGSVQSASFDTGNQPEHLIARRDSAVSGYASGDEGPEGPAQKRAKVIQQNSTEKPNTNIERQAGSLRVAASTAASVRIHRPTPLHPALQPQESNEDPVRPPTPIPSGPPGRRGGVQQRSLLRRESTGRSQYSQLAEHMVPDEHPMTTATSPEDVRGGNPVDDTPFNMPSSPPVMDHMYPQTSSPGLPPMPDHDSGFMSGGPLDSMMDDSNCNHDERFNSVKMAQAQRNTIQNQQPPSGQGLSALRPGASNSGTGSQQQQVAMSDNFADCPATEGAPRLPPPSKKLAGSRPSSRASVRPSSKPLAPAPVSQRETEAEQQARAAMGPTVPASEPAQPTQNAPRRAQSVDVPMSEMASTTPAPTRLDETKSRSGAGYRRSRQVQARLDQCIKEGTVPPYCENCGAIDTTTWRRAWSKVIDGDAEVANSYSNDPGMLYWEVVETDDQDQVTSFKLFKKSLANEDKDFTQLLLCNPCGLWLHKCKTMRPENKWNKAPPKDKKKRKSGRVRIPDAQGAATRSREKRASGKATASSPGGTEASSPAGDDESTPGPEKGNDDLKEAEAEPQSQDTGIRRATSAEPPTSGQKREGLLEDNAVEALRRAIQSSPARNMEARKVNFSEPNLTPKPVRRNLFSSSKDEDAMRTLSDAFINGMGRGTRSTPNKNSATQAEKENNPPGTNDGLDELFGTGDGVNTEIPFPSTPTPKRRSPRRHASSSNENDPPGSPSPTAARQKGTPRVPQAAGKDPKASPYSQQSQGDGLMLSMFDCENGSGTQNASSLSVDDEYLRSLFETNSQPVDGFQDILDSELFDSSLVDPQIFDMWAKDSGSGAPGNEDMAEIDDAVFSAIMQDVNGKEST